ncbi:hypothetical protein JCM15765_00120 [Paradesulfitobacterium aromaticivorans]
MIQIKVYKNGYEITGHAKPKICSEVSFWHWLTSGMIVGLDKSARRYDTFNDNPQNLNEGLSWAIYDPEVNNLEWLIEDLVISAETWGKGLWGNQVSIKRVDGVFLPK